MCFRTIFYSQKFPVNRQNTAWKKSSHGTVLRNPSGGLKFFLVVLEAPNLHHVDCIYSHWRKWVQFGPTNSMAIFGRCEKFTSVIALFVKTFLCTLRHPKTTWYHSEASFHISQVPKVASVCISWVLGSNNEFPPAKKRFEGKIRYFSINYGSDSCDRHRTWRALITTWINAIAIEKVHLVL